MGTAARRARRETGRWRVAEGVRNETKSRRCRDAWPNHQEGARIGLQFQHRPALYLGEHTPSKAQFPAWNSRAGHTAPSLSLRGGHSGTTGKKRSVRILRGPLQTVALTTSILGTVLQKRGSERGSKCTRRLLATQGNLKESYPKRRGTSQKFNALRWSECNLLYCKSVKTPYLLLS